MFIQAGLSTSFLQFAEMAYLMPFEIRKTKNLVFLFYHKTKFSTLECYILANSPPPPQKKGGAVKMLVKISMDR